MITVAGHVLNRPAEQVPSKTEAHSQDPVRRVPVGTPVTRRPPGGSLRAHFGHKALALDVGDRSERAGKGEEFQGEVAIGP